MAHYACGISLFGKLAKIRGLLRTHRLPATAALTIGDEIRDLEAAESVGVAFGAVAWGYTTVSALAARRPTHLFTTVDDIIACVT